MVLENVENELSNSLLNNRNFLNFQVFTTYFLVQIFNTMALGFYTTAFGIVTGILIYCYYYWENNQQENPHGSQNYNNQNKKSNQGNSSTTKIPPKPSDICIICSELLQSPLEQLPCQHLFHQKCLSQWFEFDAKINYRCPLCRYQLNQAEYNVYRKRL